MSKFIPNNEHYLKRARNLRNELLNKADDDTQGTHTN